MLGHRNALAHGWVRADDGVDLARLDSVPADFHLVIDAPQEDELPVGTPGREVPRAIQPFACHRVVHEALRGQFGPANISTRDTATP